jgi:hypothetical protein
MMILFFNYTVQYFDFTEKRRKPSASPSVTKKRASTSSNKENVIEIIDLDENPRLDQQKRMNDLAQDMLNIQKQKNDELEKEIMLLEKRNQILGLDRL